jgi:hypothetical protein
MAKEVCVSPCPEFCKKQPLRDDASIIIIKAKAVFFIYYPSKSISFIVSHKTDNFNINQIIFYPFLAYGLDFDLAINYNEVIKWKLGLRFS